MIKTLECFEMPIICFNQYLSRILILTLWLGILHIKFSDVLQNISQLPVVLAVQSISTPNVE